jgi:uncharacterized membrane protein
VQFSNSAYSPRLVLWLSQDPILWHAMGTFTATFLFALVALGWVDRDGSGQVPFFSTWLVIILLIASVLVLARLVPGLTTLQVTEVLYFISHKGRQVIQQVYPLLATAEAARQPRQQLPHAEMPTLPVTQTIRHTGVPMTIAAYDVSALVSLATRAGGVIAMSYAVGDTLLEGDTLGIGAFAPATARSGRLSDAVAARECTSMALLPILAASRLVSATACQCPPDSLKQSIFFKRFAQICDDARLLGMETRLFVHIPRNDNNR